MNFPGVPMHGIIHRLLPIRRTTAFKMIIRIIITVLLPVLLFTGVKAETLTAKVIGVTDGDTVKVLTTANQKMIIHLASVDAPEKGQPYGNASSRFLNDLIDGEIVRMKIATLDGYKDPVAWLYLQELCINEKMVAAGYAWQYKEHFDDATLARLERGARDAHRGLWQGRNPMPPWEWRKHKWASEKVTSPKKPKPGDDADPHRVVERYSLKIGTILNNNLDLRGFYTNRNDVKAVIILMIDRDGYIQDTTFEQRSGNEYFDDLCMQAIRRSDPLPPMPPNWRGPYFPLVVGFSPSGLEG